jgi:hypothetical protein
MTSIDSIFSSIKTFSFPKLSLNILKMKYLNNLSLSNEQNEQEPPQVKDEKQRDKASKRRRPQQEEESDRW